MKRIGANALLKRETPPIGPKGGAPGARPEREVVPIGRPFSFKQGLYRDVPAAKLTRDSPLSSSLIRRRQSGACDASIKLCRPIAGFDVATGKTVKTSVYAP
jgi:hypothetical protein